MQASIDQIRDFLLNPGKLAIVGASTKENKAGFYVPKYLRSLGFETILVNPMVDEIQTTKTLKSLDDVAGFDLKGVIIYRKLPIAEKVALKAIDMDIPFIWLPDRIVSEKAEKLAEEKNLLYVQDDCPLRIGKRLKIAP
ncbi:MAG: hypothetical protein HeimC2_04870 [Candidatus Heimdallarchaeota archaeon LC_2]|nr:MAG: hypothetical protein HeimC2_04870 [Candidatus Heimdallarchaeota archaeon LC_2]